MGTAKPLADPQLCKISKFGPIPSNNKGERPKTDFGNSPVHIISDDQLIHISDRIAAACKHPQRICGSDWIFTYLFAFKFEFSGNFL